jgi:Lar family restriction alleviation protein
MSDLKPCPFCGVDTAHFKIGHGDLGKTYWVECLGCRSAGSEGTKAQAIAAWNTRTDLIPAMIEEAVQAERKAILKLRMQKPETAPDKHYYGTFYLGFKAGLGALRAAIRARKGGEA